MNTLSVIIGLLQLDILDYFFPFAQWNQHDSVSVLDEW